MLAVDDEGKSYELAPDPMNEEISRLLSGIQIGAPETTGDRLRGILSNEKLFGVNLYEAGIGHKIEEMFREMTAGQGAALETVKRWTESE